MLKSQLVIQALGLCAWASLLRPSHTRFPHPCYRFYWFYYEHLSNQIAQDLNRVAERNAMLTDHLNLVQAARLPV